MFYRRNLASIWKWSSGRLLKVDRKNIGKFIPILIVDQSLITRLRLFVKNLIMGSNEPHVLHPTLRPPEEVKGMTTLDRDKFAKTVLVPGIKLPRKVINLRLKMWKPYLLKLKNLKPIADLDEYDPLKDTHTLFLLNPATAENRDGNLEFHSKLEQMGCEPEALEEFEIEIGYDNWTLAEVMRAILPHDAESISSYTQIGHIAHLNLKDENLVYKNVIGEVILDKVSSVKTVVNKLGSIDNTYRNFEMELLAGENNFITQTKEHKCLFELDFSKVYWNSRLGTEHQRIVEAIPKSSVVYDIFAGVGPYTVPLVKKRDCTVFANDLNPDSYSFLTKNIDLNKLKKDLVQTFNMDGRDFIRTVVKKDLRKRIESAFSNPAYRQTESSSALTKLPKTYVIMNLPALAMEFLDSFASLLVDLPMHFRDQQVMDAVLPFVYCYAFCSTKVGKHDLEAEVLKRAHDALRHYPTKAGVRVVRNVAPNKEMICLTFRLTSDVVFTPEINRQSHGDAVPVQEPEYKRPRIY